MRPAAAVAVVLLGCGGAAKDGAKGPDGSDGEPCTVQDTADGAVISCPDGSSVTVSDGADGEDGVSEIASSIFCGGTLEGTGLSFSYQAAVMTSGDVFAYGGIYGAAFQIGASSYYAAEQNGASVAAVIFAYDAIAPANGGFWALSLNRTTAVTTIAYNDVDATGGQDTWTMQPADCVVNNF